jgi:hypothetical protein
MPEGLQIAIYALCAATSLACAVMLYRGFIRSGARFLLWSCLCFVGLAINNILLFVDLGIYSDRDVGLTVWRSVSGVVGMVLLVFGLIWDAE